MGEIPGYLDWFPGDLIVPGAIGALLFVVGWIFAGASVIGQPHIMVRFMALDDVKHLNTARIYYYGFFTVFYAMATGVGMVARILLPDLGALDPELALPTMAQTFLPPVLVGVILAGIFSATMSTADSLVLSCSAALTHDLLPKRAESKWEIKIATLAVTVLALAIALVQPQSIFSLVILSWSALASAFAPLLIVYALKHNVPERLGLAMVIVGPAVAVYWRELGWHNSIYEGLPGILAGLAVFYIGAPLMRNTAKIKIDNA
jgi:Na+/proline symporter